MEVSYDGTKYHGWQRQNNATSVQEVIEDALETVLKSKVVIVASGRTDAGVHAKQQFVHFDFEKLDCDKLTYRLNSFLPREIAVKRTFEVKEDAHARFDAKSRTYKYYLHRKKDPFSEGKSHYFQRNLDISLINQACGKILKHEDFECFSKVKTDVNNFNCKISECRWTANGDTFVFLITANRFLRGMVRAIVGTLLNVGVGKLSLDDFDLILMSKKRSSAGASAPACGLYLKEVIYPESIYL